RRARRLARARQGRLRRVALGAGLRALAQRAQHDGIDTAVVQPLLQVLHPRPLAQPLLDRAAAADAPKQLGELGLHLLERDQLLLGRAPEEEVLDRVEALELRDRVGMVVDPQVDQDVRSAAVAAVGLAHDHRCRLAAAAVAAGLVARCQRGEQALDQRPLRALEGVPQRLDDRGAREQVALGGVAGAGPATGPVEALRPGERRAPAGGVDDADLALGPAWIVPGEAVDGLLRA